MKELVGTIGFVAVALVTFRLVYPTGSPNGHFAFDQKMSEVDSKLRLAAIKL